MNWSKIEWILCTIGEFANCFKSVFPNHDYMEPLGSKFFLICYFYNSIIYKYKASGLLNTEDYSAIIDDTCYQLVSWYWSSNTNNFGDLKFCLGSQSLTAYALPLDHHILSWLLGHW